MWSDLRTEYYTDYRGQWWVLSQRRDDGVCRVRMCFTEDDVMAVRREWGLNDAC
jgi:hypothetical protein